MLRSRHMGWTVVRLQRINTSNNGLWLMWGIHICLVLRHSHISKCQVIYISELSEKLIQLGSGRKQCLKVRKFQYHFFHSDTWPCKLANTECWSDSIALKEKMNSCILLTQAFPKLWIWLRYWNNSSDNFNMTWMQHNQQHNSQTQECQSAVQLFRLSAQPSSQHHSMVVQCIYSLSTHFTSPSPACFPVNILDVYSSMWVI